MALCFFEFLLFSKTIGRFTYFLHIFTHYIVRLRVDFSCTAKSRSFYFQIYFVDKIKTNHLHAVITLTLESTFSVTFNLQLVVYEDFGVGVIAIIMYFKQS